MSNTCGWCHLGPNFERESYEFTCPTSPFKTVTFQIYNGSIRIDIEHPVDPRPSQIAFRAKYCPFCGEKLEKPKKNMVVSK